MKRSHFWVMLFVCWACPAGENEVQAAPLVDSRLGGLGLVGPASTHPASFLYNPAALDLQGSGLLSLLLDGTVRLGHGSIQREPIGITTGEPATTGQLLSFEEQSLFEFFPNVLFALSSNLGSDSVVLSLSAYTNHNAHYSFLRGGEADDWFDPTLQGPARYFATDFTLYHLFGTLAASYRIIDELTIGVSTSAIYGRLDFGFARDAALAGGTRRDQAGEYVALDDCGGSPCNYEADEAAEAIRVRGSAWGLGFSVGVVARPHPTVDLGLAYVSRPYGGKGDELNVHGDAWVRRSQAAVENAEQALGTPVERDLLGHSTVTYALPDMVHFGATWRATRKLLLDLQLRWINLSVHERLTIRLTGAEFRNAPTIDPLLVHHRGYRDVFGVQLGAGYALRPTLQLQIASMVETSGLPTDAVSPVAIDGTKLDSVVALRWALGPYVTLSLGYNFIWLPALTVDHSRYSPSAMVSCADATWDVDLQSCKEVARGRGLSSAAGTYALFTHHVGTSLVLRLP